MKKLLASIFMVVGLSFSANATITVVFDSIPDGTTDFINTVTGAGGTPLAQTLAFGTSVYTDFSMSRAPSTTHGIATGSQADISPSGSGTDPLNYQGSGVTFTFNSAINSFGLEVGDWGTCCQPSALYISFDGNAPIQVGLSQSYGDVFFGGNDDVFVAAFDDSGSFSTINFWGDGVGELLYAGGTIRYAELDEGSLPPTPGIPEPATWLMMIMGFGLVGVASRRRKTVWRRILGVKPLV